MRLGFVKWFLVGLAVATLSGCGEISSCEESNSSTGGGNKPIVQDPDTTPPVITIIGDNPMTITKGDIYTEEGATAIDDVDGVVSVVTTGDVDTNTVGTYTKKYNAKDSAGNTAKEVVRTVNIVDTTPPVITIIGDNPMTITKGDIYTEEGATATDDVDGVVSVITIGDVDADIVDTYTITYTATDKAGNSAEANRTVTVEEALKQVKKTGQTKSYNESGSEVTDGSLKDDGFYQKGIASSYTRDDANNIVTDHITGLQWQDNSEAKTVRKQWLTDANDDICDNNTSSPACLDTTGDTASTYCSNLDLGTHTDWRLPTIDELMYIADRSKRDPAIDISYFENVVSGHYWSSTTVVGYSNGAWNVYFYNGHDGWGNKDYSYYVRCVRDGQ